MERGRGGAGGRTQEAGASPEGEAERRGGEVQGIGLATRLCSYWWESTPRFDFRFRAENAIFLATRTQRRRGGKQLG